ncbi:hypothetical protein MNBD_IGNAVI01-379 [hydrothermal vent metagenome]|uniref:DUF2490 domain-containing protein n=1 Tax=hydrothermal vent metagenome TaxID=652676 RepID=A0A3B1CNJ4_9ZZZZ
MKTELKTILLILPLQLFFFGSLKSQSNSDVSSQIWIDVNPSYVGIPGLELFGDAGTRWEINDKSWIRLVLRPSMRVPIGKGFYFAAGLGNFYTINDAVSNRWEIRPFQGVSFTWPKGRIFIRHYIRLEERFDFNTTTWNSKNSLRGRYKLAVSHRWAAIQAGRYWQISATGEAFITLLGQQGQFQEQARVTLGLDRSFRYDLHFRFEVTWQLEQLFFSKRSVSDIYFRLRYTYRWGKN